MVNPSYTPLTPPILAIVSVVKSEETDTTLLYFKLVPSITLIVSFGLTPENNFPGLVTWVPVTLTSVIPLGNFLGIRTASAVKSGKSGTLADPVCSTFLIWSIVFWVNSSIVNAVSIPLTISFSPITKVPEVWLRAKFLPGAPLARTTKPLAPLLFPFINVDVVKSVVSTFKVITVWVWIS